MNTYQFTEQQARTLTQAAFDAGVNSISCQLGTCDASYIDDAAVAFDRESAVLVALAAIIAEPKVSCSSLINPEARSLQDLIPAAAAPMDEFGAQVSRSGDRVFSCRLLLDSNPQWVVREADGWFAVVVVDDGDFWTKTDKNAVGKNAYFSTRSAAQTRANELNKES